MHSYIKDHCGFTECTDWSTWCNFCTAFAPATSDDLSCELWTVTHCAFSSLCYSSASSFFSCMIGNVHFNICYMRIFCTVDARSALRPGCNFHDRIGLKMFGVCGEGKISHSLFIYFIYHCVVQRGESKDLHCHYKIKISPVDSKNKIPSTSNISFQPNYCQNLNLDQFFLTFFGLYLNSHQTGIRTPIQILVVSQTAQ